MIPKSKIIYNKHTDLFYCVKKQMIFVGKFSWVIVGSGFKVKNEAKEALNEI